MSVTCEAFASWVDLTVSPFSAELCGEPAIGTVFAACEHEHVNERPVCAACAAELQRDCEGWQCAHCGHDCLLRYEIRFSSGEVVVLSGGAS